MEVQQVDLSSIGTWLKMVLKFTIQQNWQFYHATKKASKLSTLKNFNMTVEHN